MLVLENFKNIPRSPYGEATRLKCNFFFFKFATKSLEKKKGLSPPQRATAPLSPTPGATIQWARQGGRSPLLRATGGACRPPTGDRVRPPI